MKRILIILFFLLLLPTVCLAEEPNYITNLFPGYEKHELNCSYEVSTSGNQGVNDSGAFVIDINFTNEMVDEGYINSNWGGTALEVWKGTINGKELKTDSYFTATTDKSGKVLYVSLGNDFSSASDYLATATNYAIHPKNGNVIYNYDSNSRYGNIGKYKSSSETGADYSTCPDLVFTYNKYNKKISIYPSTFSNIAQLGNTSGTIFNMNLVQKENDGKINYEFRDESGYTGNFSVCNVGIEIGNQDGVGNLSIRVYENGGVSMMFDGKVFTKAHVDEDVVWQSTTQELVIIKNGIESRGIRTIKITKSMWQSIESQIGYKKCKEDSEIEATLTLLDEKDSNGRNIIGLSKDKITSSEGGTGDIIGKGDGIIDTGGWGIGSQISSDSSTCEQLLGGKNSGLIKFMQSAWTIIKVVSIIIVILMAIFDLIGTMTKSKDELMACLNKNIKRIIIVIIILLLPTLIDFIGTTIFSQNNILCGIK